VVANHPLALGARPSPSSVSCPPGVLRGRPTGMSAPGVQHALTSGTRLEVLLQTRAAQEHEEEGVVTVPVTLCAARGRSQMACSIHLCPPGIGSWA
jgi:hypothetical protein